MRSHLLEGKVRHRRTRPAVYELEHDVFYFALDLAEIDDVARRFRLVSRNRPNVFSFRDRRPFRAAGGRRAGGGPGPPPRRRAWTRDGWRITLIASLRTFGYVFNPASFYLCRNPEGELEVVIVEVHNTHGERHLYTLRPQATPAAHVASMDKAFYVSPFIGMSAQYTVRVQDRPDGAAHRDRRVGRRRAAAAGERRPAPAAVDQSGAGAHARPAPVRHPEDDRTHPLARAATVAQRHPVPSSQ